MGYCYPVRQAFQPDSTATENQHVRLESLTYEQNAPAPLNNSKCSGCLSVTGL